MPTETVARLPLERNEKKTSLSSHRSQVYLCPRKMVTCSQSWRESSKDTIKNGWLPASREPQYYEAGSSCRELLGATRCNISRCSQTRLFRLLAERRKRNKICRVTFVTDKKLSCKTSHKYKLLVLVFVAQFTSRKLPALTLLLCAWPRLPFRENANATKVGVATSKWCSIREKQVNSHLGLALQVHSNNDSGLLYNRRILKCAAPIRMTIPTDLPPSDSQQFCCNNNAN